MFIAKPGKVGGYTVHPNQAKHLLKHRTRVWHMCVEMASGRGKDWRGKEYLNSQRCLANKADSNNTDLEVGL